MTQIKYSVNYPKAGQTDKTLENLENEVRDYCRKSCNFVLDSSDLVGKNGLIGNYIKLICTKPIRNTHISSLQKDYNTLVKKYGNRVVNYDVLGDFREQSDTQLLRGFNMLNSDMGLDNYAKEVLLSMISQMLNNRVVWYKERFENGQSA